MITSHPSPESLERYVFAAPSEGSHPDGGVAAAHLVRDCPICSEVVSSWWTESGGTWRPERDSTEVDAFSGDSAYAEVIDRVLSELPSVAREVAAEQAQARQSLQRLLEQPLERRLILVENSRAFRTWAVCELLLESSFEKRYDNPTACEELARVAVTAAALLDVGRYGAELTEDLRGRSWAYLANARRILGHFRLAEAALRTARAHLERGTGNPLDCALCWEVEASLYKVRGDTREAIRCSGRAVTMYRGVGERNLLGRALIQKGMLCGRMDDIDREVVLVRTGLSLIDPDDDHRLALAGWHNLCQALHQRGDDRQALAALGRARPLYLLLGDRASLMRFQWLEGSIAASLGRYEQAEGCLREAREGFIQLQLGLDAAFVSLDLAGLLARQARTAEVYQLAAETIRVFEAHESRRETLAAFIVLRQAAEQERVTEALLKRVRSSLRGAQAR